MSSASELARFRLELKRSGSCEVGMGEALRALLAAAITRKSALVPTRSLFF